MDTFIFIRNCLEKTRHSILWSFTNWKESSDWSSSHQSQNSQKNACARVFFWGLQLGRRVLCFMAFSEWEFVPQRFKNICCSKIDCGKHYRLSEYFIKFPRTRSGKAKAIATFKETTHCKIIQADHAIWAPGNVFS